MEQRKGEGREEARKKDGQENRYVLRKRAGGELLGDEGRGVEEMIEKGEGAGGKEE